LISDPGRQARVMLDLAVEFHTLVTHFQFRINTSLQSTLAAAVKTANQWRFQEVGQQRRGRAVRRALQSLPGSMRPGTTPAKAHATGQVVQKF
jgi:hypothetical protein